jgi:hypothetical protein
MLFISLCVPVINGILHVGSSREAVQQTSEWVNSIFAAEGEKIDPKLALSTLVIAYVVDKGYKANGGDPEKRKTWRRIVGRMQKSIL